MKQNKQDRRSQRTQQLVISALMGLMQEQRYDAITVQDLLDRAGIGRSTFYTHYFDKEDVLESMVEYLFETLRLETEMPYSPEQMDQWFRNVTLPGIQAAIEGRHSEWRMVGHGPHGASANVEYDGSAQV